MTKRKKLEEQKKELNKDPKFRKIEKNLTSEELYNSIVQNPSILKEYKPFDLYYEAVFSKNKELVELLIKNKIDINDTSTSKDNALFTALNNGSIEIAQLLIDNNINVNHKNIDDETPLHSLLTQEIPEKLEAIALLINCKADLDARNNKGEAPLHIAANVTKEIGIVK